MKERIKAVLFRLLGKDPEAVVAAFATGPPDKVRAMVEEVRRLIPDRRHILVERGSLFRVWQQLRRYRIGMAPVLFDREPGFAPLRLIAFLLAPTKILAYNERLERHHLRMRTWLASWLFWRGVPLDRIYLRPRWLWLTTADRTITPDDPWIFPGRQPRPGHRRIAVLTPFSPWPLAHGGAVRLYNLLREMAREFDVYLFAFREKEQGDDLRPLAEFCTSVHMVSKPRYREPRWASLLPPEVREYESGPMRRLIAQVMRDQQVEVMQVEYTQLARYPGDVLVEHDVTSDLYDQLHRQRRTLSSWWDWWRWQRFEREAVRRYSRVVTMSEKDARLLRVPQAHVIPNGVDLARFRPVPEAPGQRVLFIGSFRHFPNVTAYRFFLDEVWPLVKEECPEMTVTVVAGADPLQYVEMPGDPRIRLLGFVADVRPLYQDANIVLAPTLVSAGTNVKVLEAMAMERAVVSTTSGCGGIPVEHGVHVWIADGAQAFAEGMKKLAADGALRRALARNAGNLVEANFDWSKLGEMQRDLVRGILPRRLVLREGRVADLARVREIQAIALPTSRWDAEQYLSHEFYVALYNGSLAGFIVARKTAPDEREILNVAVGSEYRRLGIGEALLQGLIYSGELGDVFLEVRESNIGARRLYESLGFEDVGRRANYYEDPPETAVIMRIVVSGKETTLQNTSTSGRQT